MSFEIDMKVCGTTIYSVYGRRLTSNKNGWNTYEYQAMYTPKDFFGVEPDENRGCTMSYIAGSKLEHQYEDGLIVLCEKVLNKINKELEE